MVDLLGVRDVEAALEGLEVPFRSIRAEGASALQAARSLNAPLSAIVKSLLFLADGEPVLVLVGGDRRADPRRLKQVLGARRVMIASRERVAEETGFPPGAVPPLGHRRLLPTWIDSALADHETIYVSGGAPDMMLALRFQDLVGATNGRLAGIGR